MPPDIYLELRDYDMHYLLPSPGLTICTLSSGISLWRYL